MTTRHELENLIRGIDEEIADAKRDIKEAETVGDDEAKRLAEQDIAALQNQRQRAVDSLIRIRNNFTQE
jgi:hypothetical protein